MQLPTCSPSAPSRRPEFLSLSPGNAAEVSVFARTPSSGKAPSPRQASHLQAIAGKCSDFGKVETCLAASHSRRGVRSKGFEAVVGGDGLCSCCPLRIHAPGPQRLFGEGWKLLNSSSTRPPGGAAELRDEGLLPPLLTH